MIFKYIGWNRQASGFLVALVITYLLGSGNAFAQNEQERFADYEFQLDGGFELLESDNDIARLSFIIDADWDEIIDATWNGISVRSLLFEIHQYDIRNRIVVGVLVSDLVNIGQLSGELSILTEDVTYTRYYEFVATSQPVSNLLASGAQSVNSDESEIFQFIIPRLLRSLVSFSLRRALANSARTTIRSVRSSNTKGLPASSSRTFARSIEDKVRADLERKVATGEKISSAEFIDYGKYRVFYRVVYRIGRWRVENYEIEQISDDPALSIPESIELFGPGAVIESIPTELSAQVIMQDGSSIIVQAPSDLEYGFAHWWATNDDTEDVAGSFIENSLTAFKFSNRSSERLEINVRFVLNGVEVTDDEDVLVYD